MRVIIRPAFADPPPLAHRLRGRRLHGSRSHTLRRHPLRRTPPSYGACASPPYGSRKLHCTQPYKQKAAAKRKSCGSIFSYLIVRVTQGRQRKARRGSEARSGRRWSLRKILDCSGSRACLRSRLLFGMSKLKAELVKCLIKLRCALFT
jgi:hypothetical protein